MLALSVTSVFDIKNKMSLCCSTQHYKVVGTAEHGTKQEGLRISGFIEGRHLHIHMAHNANCG